MKQYQLLCPICGKVDIVNYKTKPPVYCSDACRQKAYRLRRKRNSSNVTNLQPSYDVLAARFGERAAAVLSDVYDRCGCECGKQCEAAMFESMQHAIGLTGR